jgi:hypothetical protein
MLQLVLGAVLGAFVTAYATWWVSVRLDRQNELRQLRSAIRIVRTELIENGARIANADDNPETVRGAVLLGDWLGSKIAFAGLSPRNEALWRDVARTYGEISDFKFDRRDEPPTVDHLNTLVSRLEEEERKVDKDIRKFSRFLPWFRTNPWGAGEISE